jgi:UDP-glucose 4-epimerase
MKNIVIFGASGNSGQYIVNKLVKDGHNISAIGRSDIKHFKKIGVEYYRGDIQDKAFMDNLPMNNIDVVINLAGVQPSILPFSEQTDFEKTMYEYLNVNIMGVFNVIDFCRKREVSKYIYTTSHRDIEGHWIDGKLLDRNLHPAINYQGDHVMYAITKASSMMIGDYYRDLLGIKVFNLRLPMIFSVPTKNWYYSNGEKKIIPFLSIFRNASLGRQLEVWGDKNMKRDYVHKDNFISMVSLCLKSNLAGGTFNVGTGEAVTTENFIKEIAKVFSPKGESCPIVYKPENETYKCTSYDIEDEKKLLGYKPVLLSEMLIRLKEEIIEKNIFEQWD